MDLIDAASTELERVVRRLPPDAWDRRTPSGWTVRGLVEHLVIGNRMTTLLLAGADRAAARTQATRAVPLDDPVAAVVESSHRQAEAFARALPTQPVPGPSGTVSAAQFLRFRLIDLVVHAWDLLRAAGLDEALEPQVVDALVTLVEPHLDELLATGAYGAGPSAALPPDASAQTRLLDWFGRRP